MYVISKYLLKTDYILGILLCTEDTNIFKVKALLNDRYKAGELGESLVV